MQGDFPFGAEVSVAGCYLFAMLLWTKTNGLDVPAPFAAFRDHMMELPSVKTATAHKGSIRATGDVGGQRASRPDSVIVMHLRSGPAPSRRHREPIRWQSGR